MTAHPSPSPKTYADAAELAIGWAFDHLHVPYVLGGEGKDGIDCSGLTKVAWSYASAGAVDLEHYAGTQYFQTSRIFHAHIGYLRRGDLVFYYAGEDRFAHEDGHVVTGPGHVAIYLGWYEGVRWVVQATMIGVPSEVVPMRGYAEPCGFGRVRFADWNHKTHEKAVYHGAHIDTAKWARYL